MFIDPERVKCLNSLAGFSNESINISYIDRWRRYLNDLVAVNSKSGMFPLRQCEMSFTHSGLNKSLRKF